MSSCASASGCSALGSRSGGTWSQMKYGGAGARPPDGALYGEPLPPLIRVANVAAGDELVNVEAAEYLGKSYHGKNPLLWTLKARIC